MTNRTASAVAVALAAAAAIGSGACRGSLAPSERSVILVTLDTTRADRIGAFGGKSVPTPRLDAAAAESTVFEDAVSQVPLTLPSHASMMTGKYPASHGVRHNGLYRLAESEETLAERLRAAGLETAAFVGAFVVNRGFGLEQGFDRYDDIAVDRFRGGEDQVFEAQRTADEVNARVFEWLKHWNGQRAFLWVHYYDPHDPYQPPEKPGRQLSGEGYDREISYVDACFGDLVDRLRSAGLWDRSIVVVVGDHGEGLGEHNELGHGIFLYQTTLHVPLFIRAPDLVPSGKRVGGPVELVDIAPTVLSLLGLPPLEKAQGKDLRPRITGQDDGRLASAHAETLMPRLEFGWSELRMFRDGRFKYVQAPRPELYDLASDPAERKNLLPSESTRVEEMKKQLSDWAAQTMNSAVEETARRSLTAEEEERLRSLGYLSGDSFKKGESAASSAGSSAVDPKDGMAERKEVEQARLLLGSGSPAEAVPLFEAVLHQNPRNQIARGSLIDALIQLERYTRAEEEGLAALAIAQGDPDTRAVLIEKARDYLATTYRLQKRHREAEEQLRLILSANPTASFAQVKLARLLASTGRADEARRLIDEVLARDPRYGIALAVRFRLETVAGDRAAAIKTARTLADERTGEKNVLVDAGRLLLQSGEAERAIACFELALEQERDLDPGLLAHLGDAQLAAGKLDAARESYRALTKITPRDPRAHFFLGAISLRLGDEASARESFATATSLNPKYAAPRLSLARYLLSKGRREEAVRTLEEALAMSPQDPRIRQMLDEARAR
jgi:arylsulfatase A-like enzyme/predicted Zn-dependent protease